MEDARLRIGRGRAAGRQPDRRRRGLGDPVDLPRRAAWRAGRARSPGVVIHNEKDVRSLGLLLAHVERRYAEPGDAPRGAARRPRRARPGLHPRPTPRRGARVPRRRARRGPAPVRDPFGRTPPPRPLLREQAEEDAGGRRRRAGRTSAAGRRAAAGAGALANGRGGRSGRRPARRRGTRRPRWTDERLAAERARMLRRLGRWAESAEAWQTAAAAGGGARGRSPGSRSRSCASTASAIPSGALAATRAAWRLLERTRVTGRPHPRLEADLDRRGRRLTARLRRRATRAQRRAAP